MSGPQEGPRLWPQHLEPAAWAPISVLLFISNVTLGEGINLPALQFPRLSNRDDNKILHFLRPWEE